MNTFNCDGKIIRDELGRHRIFKGLNIVIKTNKLSVSKFKEHYCCDKYIDMLNSNGFNIIRLGLTWELIEPIQSKYSLEYINAIKDFINICKQNDIYIMLDMHQDLFSTYLGNVGDGAPLWAVENYQLHQKPYAIWAEGYFYMDNVQNAFYDFWHNERNLQDKYIKMWGFFAKQFEDCDNVIAFDYMNEPYVDKNGRKIFLTIIERVVKKIFGKNISLEHYFDESDNKKAFLKSALELVKNINTPKKLKLLQTTMDNSANFGEVVKGLDKYTEDFNKYCYEPFIKNISSSVNPSLKYFNVIEHNYYSNLGIPFEIEAPQNCLYSPHAYDIFVDSPLYNKYSSNERIKYITSTIKQNQDKMNLPVLFGEWGAGAKGHEWTKHIDYIMGIMEDNLWSNIYWSYDDKKLHNIMNRPYPVAFNGTIRKIKTSTKDRNFYLEWEQEKTKIPNLLYMPNEGVVEIDGVKGVNTYKIKY